MSSQKDFAIIDLETTGGDPSSDRITEIAIARFNGEEVVETFTSLVNPGMPIPEFITRITGIDNEMVREAPKFYEIAKRVVEMTQGAVFVAHNVRFDYSFIQKEFRQLGYTFSRPQLCTIKLSKKVLPDLKSYSLSNLCKSLKIKNEAPHRAWGDVDATVKLFKHLIGVDEKGKIREFLQDEMSEVRVPPELDRKVLAELPEETGVYYFLDKGGRVIYVGKSTNIRKRVMSHFSSAHKSKRSMRMFEQVTEINYELTGSELMALLLENEEIKRILPKYNRAQTRRSYKFGIYAAPNPDGYLELFVDKYNAKNSPLAGFSGRTHAESALASRGRKAGLCPKLYGAERGPGRCFHHQLHICQGACIGEESPESYNERVQELVDQMALGKINKDSYLIVGKGRNYEEKSVVLIQDGFYRGHTYMESSFLQQDIHAICEAIPVKKEAPDVQRIIRAYIRKHPKEVKQLQTNFLA
ncbi:MAG: GIY-YIG nuclease family protein [Bacteroidia bacterium]|nr:GIY-YIG nuclease family protein [Bacteroidia bacterium]